MIKHLQHLCNLPGVSGNEQAVRNYMIDHVMPHDYKVDTLGNVIVQVKGEKPAKKTVLLAAHMDEIGFIITSITQEGTLKFAPIGGIDRRVVLGKKVRIGNNGIAGIIGLKPVHLSTADERKVAPKWEALYIDIGASSKEEAQEQIRLGDTGVFAGEGFQMGSLFSAKAIDDRLGCAILLSLLEKPLPMDVTMVFTVQEELGLRGAKTAVQQVKPDVALIIETTTAADLEGVPEEKTVCKLGSGVVIPFMDSGTVYDRKLYEEATKLAQVENIPWQTKTVIAGATDAAEIQRFGSGVQVLGLAAPVRNIHTAYNVLNLDDAGHLLAFTEKFLEHMGEKWS